MSYHGRQYDQAIAEFQRALERDPGSFLGLMGISLSYAAKGMYKEAIGHAERGVKRSPDVNFLRGMLGAVYAMAGERESALEPYGAHTPADQHIGVVLRLLGQLIQHSRPFPASLPTLIEVRR